jgi:uncharacterized protein (TIGR02147 family)
MTNIFEYFDFRAYLGDFYIEKKKENPSFSYQAFTEKCGFRNKSFLHQIIHTKKQISQSSVFSISGAIGHSKREAQYFENLVSFNQAKTLQEKNHHYEQLISLNVRPKELCESRLISQDQFEYYSKWYNGVIRSVIDLYPFKDDYQFLARIVYPTITSSEAKKSVELLERLEFIKKKSDGYYEVTNKVITTGDDVISTAVLNFHQQATKLAHDALNWVPREKRNISGVMLGLSESGYNQICQKISEFRKELLQIADKDKNARHVFQLNLHLFPLTDPKQIDTNKGDLE